jgi:hypothetical protein
LDAFCKAHSAAEHSTDYTSDASTNKLKRTHVSAYHGAELYSVGPAVIYTIHDAYCYADTATEHYTIDAAVDATLSSTVGTAFYGTHACAFSAAHGISDGFAFDPTHDASLADSITLAYDEP